MSYTLDILKGLNSLHSAGHFHGGVVPQNLYLTSNGRLMLGSMNRAKNTWLSENLQNFSSK